YSVTTACTPTPRSAATPVGDNYKLHVGIKLTFDNVPPDSNAGLRNKLGAQTIAKLRSVIPVLADCRDILFKRRRDGRDKMKLRKKAISLPCFRSTGFVGETANDPTSGAGRTK
ncbi:hypothetical protein Bhyg_17322, partial [Pseudolycoriella hygida]